MLVGGILSATDPVAVVALLRETGVKKCEGSAAMRRRPSAATAAD